MVPDNADFENAGISLKYRFLESEKPKFQSWIFCLLIVWPHTILYGSKQQVPLMKMGIIIVPHELND